MGSIFISYRRTGSAGYGGRLDYDLRRHFGSTAVFRDIDGILPGRPFAEIIEQAVAESSVVLVLITGEWLDVTDAEGRRRLDQPDDFVRREIESALNSGVPLIPVLVDGAKVPSAQDLPPSIRRLGELQGIELTDGRWEFDLGRLIRALEVHVGPVEQATAPTIRIRRREPAAAPVPPVAGRARTSGAVSPDTGAATRRSPVALTQRLTGWSGRRAAVASAVLVPILLATAVAVGMARSGGGDGADVATRPAGQDRAAAEPVEVPAVVGLDEPAGAVATTIRSTPNTASPQPPQPSGTIADGSPSTTQPPPAPSKPTTGNLVTNPGAEDDSASAPFTPGPPPAGWRRGAHQAAAAAYGSSGTRSGCYRAEYPTVAELGGSGAQLFIGGYDPQGGCAMAGGSVATLIQDIPLGRFGSALADVGWEASAKLGSRASSEADAAGLAVEILGSSGQRLDFRATELVSTRGPFQTKTLMGRLPAGATSARLTLSFSVSISYSGALADDVSFRLTG